jgi:uncharacterized protein involved in response to NO
VSPRFAAPLWSSGFRPFLLGGVAWGAFAVPAWFAAALAGAAPGAPLWHGHEMLFGFAAAIIAAVLLTAIPSWAITEEVSGAPLAGLAALWAAGRVAMLAGERLPAGFVAAVDSAFLPALALALAPTVLRARRKWFAAPVLVVLALATANVVFHLAVAAGDPGAAARAVEAGLLLTMLLYTLAGGVLIPVFTSARVPIAAFHVPLDALAVGSVAAFAIAELVAAPPGARGALAALAACANAVRLARWRGWQVVDEPLLWTLHAGYAWLVVALGLRAVAALGGPVPEAAWAHAFTVGALGLTILGLGTRVVLRHTGRPALVPGAMVAANFMMLGAAIARVGTAFAPGAWLLVASMTLWSAALVVYLGCFARYLVAASLPRAAASG